jgi:hypothetical protein
MGNYLKDVHGIEALHVMARHPSKNYGHEWLELESDVIEITLDQFGATLPKAYSGPALSFHRELKVQSKDVVSRIGKFDMIRGIEDVYRTIVSQMKTSDGR